MKKYLLFFLLVIKSLSAFPQVGTTAKSDYIESVITQSNSAIQVMAYYQKSAYKSDNQWGQIRITNISNQRIDLDFNVVVTTVCGKTKTSHFFAHANPGDNSDGVVWISATDCLGNKLTDSKNVISGSTFDEYNRIKSVGYQNLQVSLSTQNSHPVNNSLASKQSLNQRFDSTNYVPQPANKTLATQVQAYQKQHSQQDARIVSTFTEGLQDIGNILQQGREKQAAIQNERQAREETVARQGREHDSKLKAALLGRLADGNIVDVVNYGIMRLNDYNDLQTAHACFLAGAEAHHAKAMLWLALDYRNGLGGKKNDTLAVYWFKQAAASGSLIAMNQLAGYYNTGLLPSLPKDPDEAIKWFSYLFFLTTQLDKNDQLTLSMYQGSQNGFNELAEFEKTALQRLPEIGYQGIITYVGYGNDDNKRFDLIRNIVSTYQKKGTVKDLQAALVWQRLLQSMFGQKRIQEFEDKKINKDIEAGIKAIERAINKAAPIKADQLISTTQLFNKGFTAYYTSGKADSARHFFTLAATKGDREAMFLLGALGLHEAPVKVDEAITWLGKADQDEKSYRGTIAAAYYYNLGIKAEEQYDIPKALACFKQATEYSGLLALQALQALEFMYRTGYMGEQLLQAGGPRNLTPNQAEASIWEKKIDAYLNSQKIIAYRRQ